VRALSFGTIRLTPAAQRMELWGSRGLRILRTQPAAHWIALAEVSAAVVLAALSAQLLWAIAKPPEWAATYAEASKAPAQMPRQEWQTSALATVDPFHRRLAAAPARSERAPETMLSLQLFGIRAGEGTTGGSAIIAGADNVQNVYFVGQEIMPGVKLERVSAGRVMIRRNGVIESLSLDKEPPTAVSPESGASSATVAPAGEAWSRVTTGADTLFSQIQFTPRRAENGAPGLILQSGKTAGLLEQAGLMPGDVLLAVNGAPVSGVADLMAMANSLRDAERLTLEIERNSQRKVHRIAIDR